MYIATVVRDKRGRYHVRIGKEPKTGGDVAVIDILNGGELRELKERAERFVKELEERGS